MKKILMALACICLTTAIQAQDLPTTTIKDVSTGKKLAFNTIATPGKVTLVSFWATWCIPCKKEIKNITQKMPGWKAETDFNYVTISVDKAEAEGLVRTYALAQGWKFPYYIDQHPSLFLF